MNKRHKVIFRFFIENYNENLKQEIINKIESSLSKYYNFDIQAKLHSKEQYWKIPEYTEAIFFIYAQKKIEVKDLRQVFNLKFKYNSCKASDINDPEHRSRKLKNLIWAKQSDQEILLNNNIKWAQIYNNTEIELTEKEKAARVIMQLNVNNYNESLKNKLLAKIQKTIESKYKDKIPVDFRTSRPDENHPGQTYSFFNIYCDNSVTVNELKDLFNVTWDYSEPDPSTNTMIEDAFWDKDSSNNEILLDENVNWASMYTWEQHE